MFDLLQNLALSGRQINLLDSGVSLTYPCVSDCAARSKYTRNSEPGLTIRLFHRMP